MLTMKCTHIIILYSSMLFLYSAAVADAVDKLRANDTLKDGNTIVSARGEFELGFFSPGDSKKRYLGIWYKKISYGTVVWVANRETPLTNTSGATRVNNKGIVLLSNDRIIWSSNKTRYVGKPVAQLLDTGNFVFKEEDGDNFLWQSFDYPGNIMLPGMTMGIDLVTGHERYYTSWKSEDDPSPGRFTNRIDPNGFPQVFQWKDSMLWSRTGPWSGSHYSGMPIYSPNGISTQNFTFNKKGINYRIDLIDKSSSPITRFRLESNGDTRILVWNDQKQNWMVFLTIHLNDCDRYALCGAYGICNINNSPRCECMKGFAPQFPKKWKSVDWSDGCVRKKTMGCGTKEGFQKYSGVKLPDTRHSWYNMRINLNECRRLCFKNCSCTAYANADDRRGGSGCILWFDPLVDITGYSDDGQDIYVKMPASELEESWRTGVKRQLRLIAISVVLLVPVVSILLHLVKKRKLNREDKMRFGSEGAALTKIESEDLDLPLFKFKIVAKATNNFSYNNKLGEGGFGPFTSAVFYKLCHEAS